MTTNTHDRGCLICDLNVEGARVFCRKHNCGGHVPGSEIDPCGECDACVNKRIASLGECKTEEELWYTVAFPFLPNFRPDGDHRWRVAVDKRYRELVPTDRREGWAYPDPRVSGSNQPLTPQ